MKMPSPGRSAMHVLYAGRAGYVGPETRTHSFTCGSHDQSYFQDWIRVASRIRTIFSGLTASLQAHCH